MSMFYIIFEFIKAVRDFTYHPLLSYKNEIQVKITNICIGNNFLNILDHFTDQYIVINDNVYNFDFNAYFLDVFF